MNKYLASVIENVKKKHANEPEFDANGLKKYYLLSNRLSKTSRIRKTRYFKSYC